MNNYRAQIMAILIKLGDYYDRRLSPEQLEMYSDDLQDIAPSELSRAIVAYRRDPKNDRFPLPSKLRAFIGPALDPEDIGRDVASRIIGAMSKFGWNSPERAKEVIGELGWLVVQRLGGWPQLCQETTNDKVGIMTAQMRDLAITLHRRAEAGQLETAPGIPEARHPIAELASSLLKSIPAIKADDESEAG